MNTLSDTDEGKAKPSVWPVYVAAGVVLIVSLISAGLGVLPAPTPKEYIFPLLIVPFGLATAGGLLRLRVWGWWCAVAWAAIWGLSFLGRIFACVLAAIVDGHIEPCAACFPPEFDVALARVYTVVLGAVVIAPVVWPLATRRQLFFPRA